MKNAQRDGVGHARRRLLNQALRHGLTLGRSRPSPGTASCATAACATRRSSDLGLGKRLPVIVARRLAEAQDLSPVARTWSSQTGGAIWHPRLGRCGGAARALPSIPGTRSSAPCARARASKSTPTTAQRGQAARRPRRWVDVEWEHMVDDRLFDVGIRVLSHNAAACWRRWRTRSPRRTATSRASAWMAGRANTPRSTSPCRCRPHAPRARDARRAQGAGSGAHRTRQGPTAASAEDRRPPTLLECAPTATPLWRRTLNPRGTRHGDVRIRSHQVHARVDGEASGAARRGRRRAAPCGGTSRRASRSRSASPPPACRSKPYYYDINN